MNTEIASISAATIDTTITVLIVIVGVQLALTGTSWTTEVRRKKTTISPVRWGWPTALTVAAILGVWHLIQLAVLAAIGTIEVSATAKVQFVTLSLVAPSMVVLLSGGILIFQLTRKDKQLI